MTEYKWTRNLLSDEGYAVRKAVFIDEQKFTSESDERDFHCLHLLGLKDGKPFSAARIFSDDGKEWHIGRVCVLKAHRGNGAGAELLAECERKAVEQGAKSLFLDAQVRAKAFYEKAGYSVCGEEHLDEYCPHIPMRKIISED